MHEKTARKTLDDELTFPVPLSEIYKFNEPKRAQDLLSTHRGSLKDMSDMHPMKRWVLSSVGLFLLMAGMAGLFRNDPMTIVWFALGLAIIWFFFVRQEIAKRKAKTSSEKAKDIFMTFNQNHILIKSRFHEQLREWTEFVEYKKTKKGISLYFNDGVVCWLPANIFNGANEIKDLIDLFRKKRPGK